MFRDCGRFWTSPHVVTAPDLMGGAMDGSAEAYPIVTRPGPHKRKHELWLLDRWVGPLAPPHHHRPFNVITGLESAMALIGPCHSVSAGYVSAHGPEPGDLAPHVPLHDSGS